MHYYCLSLHANCIYDVGNPKIKLYKDVNGEPKGDGLCSYLKVRTLRVLCTCVLSRVRHIRLALFPGN